MSAALSAQNERAPFRVARQLFSVLRDRKSTLKRELRTVVRMHGAEWVSAIYSGDD